jgi:hypothetical protein
MGVPVINEPKLITRYMYVVRKLHSWFDMFDFKKMSREVKKQVQISNKKVSEEGQQ